MFVLCCSNTAPFTRSKKQLSKADVGMARQLSRVRIHVERVIGVMIQKYTSLESTLPINMIMREDSEFSMIDKTVTVCCALCNCCESVVPFSIDSQCSLEKKWTGMRKPSHIQVAHQIVVNLIKKLLSIIVCPRGRLGVS